MKLSEIDKNFQINTNVPKDDIIWLDASQEPFKVYGASSCNPYIRMPLDIAEKVSPGVLGLTKNTAGIRIRFKTDSSYIAIHCERNYNGNMPHMPFTGSNGFDLYTYSDKTNNQAYLKTFTPPLDSSKGYSSYVDVKSGMTEFILNFPLYSTVDKLFIGVCKDAHFEEPSNYMNDSPVVFYGSSITQGGCASRPGNCYQNFLSRALNLDYINLGFSGSGKAEDEILDYMANLKMSVFVSDYDHNAPDANYLESTHYKLYKAIRAKNPDIPYIMISRPDYNIGNSLDDARRNVIFETFIKAKNDGDKNVYLVDGASLFAGDEWFACTVDGTHPNDLGFYRFGSALTPVFKKIFY